MFQSDKNRSRSYFANNIRERHLVGYPHHSYNSSTWLLLHGLITTKRGNFDFQFKLQT